MKSLPAEGVEEDVAEAITRVVSHGERVVLHVHGEGVAALVSLEDLTRLEELEDLQDIEDAKKALAEDGENITLDQLRTELGL